MRTKVGFIGLGIMGSRMARHLVDPEIDLKVFNRSPKIYESVKELHSHRAESLEECVSNRSIVFTMLSTEEAVYEVAFGVNGFVKALPDNALWIDCTTVSPGFSTKIAKLAVKSGIRFIDAPVAGSVKPAESGDLVFLIGGNEEDIIETEPLLNKMGKKRLHIGKASMGSAFKLVINSMLAQSMLVYSEAVQLGKQLGLSDELLFETLPQLPISAPFLNAKANNLKSNIFETEFPLEWMHKDLCQLTATAEEIGQPLLLAEYARNIYAKAKDKGWSREDFSAVSKLAIS